MAIIRGNNAANSLVGDSSPFGVVNQIYGNGGADTLAGGFQADNYVYGGIGDDSISGGAVVDRLYGEAGDDSISAWQSDDAALFGGAGDDSLVGSLWTGSTLDGGAGADVLKGGEGGDVYVIDSIGDVIDETFEPEFDNQVDPSDLVSSSIDFTLGRYLENLLLTGAKAIDGAGNSGANDITGNAAANILDGAGGADALSGLAGNDTLIGGAGVDRLDGGAGTDTASYVTATRGVTVDLERPTGSLGDARGDTFVSIEIVAGSKFADVFRGTNGADKLSGDAGADVLVGRGGADRLNGGAGADTASYVDASEAVTASLAAPAQNTGDASGDAYVSIENLTGSRFADTLTGNALANALNGGAGDDVLAGGRGLDVLTGGAGADRFVFDLAGTTAGIDRISDFSVVEDTIAVSNAIFEGGVLGALKPGGFRAGLVARDADDRILYDRGSGSILFDADGAGGEAAVGFAEVTDGLALTFRDFVFV